MAVVEVETEDRQLATERVVDAERLRVTCEGVRQVERAALTEVRVGKGQVVVRAGVGGRRHVERDAAVDVGIDVERIADDDVTARKRLVEDVRRRVPAEREVERLRNRRTERRSGRQQDRDDRRSDSDRESCSQHAPTSLVEVGRRSRFSRRQ